MVTFNQKIFKGKPEYIVVVCVDGDGTVKFGTDLDVKYHVKKGSWNFRSKNNERGLKNEWTKDKKVDELEYFASPASKVIRSLDTDGLLFMGNGFRSAQCLQGLHDDVDEAVGACSGVDQLHPSVESDSFYNEVTTDWVNSVQKIILKTTGKKIKKKKIRKWIGHGS